MRWVHKNMQSLKIALYVPGPCKGPKSRGSSRGPKLEDLYPSVTLLTASGFDFTGFPLASVAEKRVYTSPHLHFLYYYMYYSNAFSFSFLSLQ